MVGPESGPERERESGVPDDVLVTKILPPRSSPHLLARPALFARLDEGTRGPLTLVCAPAGYGKTFLLVAWHASTPTPQATLAWFSLDADDNDPVRFGTHLFHALGRASPGLGERSLAWLRSTQPPSLQFVLGPLINELNALANDIVLVLDDFHVINYTPIHDALTFLIDHAPTQLHLVLLVREDPPLTLARYRAQGALVEIRQADLRFSEQETAVFVGRVAGAQPDSDDIRVLAERTEGWAVGLQLAAIALRGHADPNRFVRSFGGTHRYVMDYLVEEVLAQQPLDIQSFLLETVILEKLTASLCAAVTGRADSAIVLVGLERSNLFVVPLDDERRWYRYHHLFADLLRARLHHADPVRVARLHRKAGAWHEQEGLYDQAIRHALAAGDPEWAARMIERVAEETWTRGEVVTLARWFDVLPDAIIRSRPWLALQNAWTLLLDRGWSESVDELLRDADAAQAAETDQQFTGIAETIRSVAAVLRWDAPSAVELTTQALVRLPGTNHTWRGIAMTNQALAYRLSGDFRASIRSFEEAERLNEAAGNRYAALVVTTNMAHVLALSGRLQASRDIYDRILSLGSDSSGPGSDLFPLRSPYIGLGRVLCELGDFEAANRHLEAGIAVARHEGDVATLAFGHRALSQLRWAEGNTAAALTALTEADRLMQIRGIPLFATSDLVTWHPARLALMCGNLAAAVAWAAGSGLSANDEAHFSSEIEQVTFCRVLIAQGELNDAIRLLERIHASAAVGERLSRVIEVLAVQAIVLATQRKDAEALTTLTQALALAESAGFFRLLVDEGPPMHSLLLRVERRPFVDQLLTALGHGPGPAIEQDVKSGIEFDPLTAREREVLRLVADGLSAAEIANRLFLSPGSAKWHTNNIYRKLLVHNRVQASARAKELGLL